MPEHPEPEATDRTEAPRDLEASREWFRALAENSAEGFMVLDGDGIITYAAPAAGAILGCTDLEGRRGLDLIHPDDRDLVTAQLTELARSPGTRISVEARASHGDGGWRHLAATTVNLSENPHIHGFVCNFRDVTDRVAAEDGLRLSEERFRALVQNSSDVTLIIDGAATIAYASPSAERIFGYAPEEVVGRDGLDFMHPDDLEIALVALAQVVEDPDSQPKTLTRVRHADGSHRWVETALDNFIDDPQVAGVVAHLRDVTARVEAEEALRQSEERFRALVQNSSDAMLVVDAVGNVTYASPALARIFGRPLDEIIGKSGLDWVHPDDADELANTLAGLLDRPGAETRQRFRLTDGEGRWRWADATAVNLLHDDSVAGIVCNVRDITEQVEAEAALLASEARFRTVVDNSYDITLVVDQQANIKWITPNVERLLDYRSEALIGLSALDFVHPEDLDFMVRELVAFTSGRGIPNPSPIKVLHADGRYRHVEIVGTDLLDHPDIEGIAVNLRNIEERVAAERERRRLTDVFELSADLVGIAEPEGGLVYLNRAASSFFGITPEDELELEALLEHLPSDAIERLADEVIPALRHNDIWRGEVTLRRPDGDPVPTLAQILVHRDRSGEPQLYSCVLRDISERKAFEDRLEYEATHDPLTGLPNRALLLDRLEMALARGRRNATSVAVLFLDLDNFKVVNDGLGHSRGDRLLVDIADRLHAAIRPGDTIARFGGDEFVMLCEDLELPEDALTIAKRINHSITDPFRVDETEIFVGASVGVAFADDPGADPESLIRDADAAMYEAKKRGRSRVEIFDGTLRTRAIDRLDLENALRRAVRRDQLRLVFQPIVRLDDETTESVEALVRWEHPERGLLLPKDFIGIAEDTGLIVPIGEWVLDEACRKIMHWRAELPALTKLTLAVNLSGRQLGHPGLVERLLGIIGAVDLDPSLLRLEVTESVVMEDVEASQETLSALRAHGIRIAIDDFGTGYSSLSYLRHFPVDYLKIDQAFVAGLGVDEGDSAIVAAIVNLAHTLGLEVVAEGVETQHQLEALRQLGCDAAQGYHLGRPVESLELSGVLRPA